VSSIGEQVDRSATSKDKSFRKKATCRDLQETLNLIPALQRQFLKREKRRRKKARLQRRWKMKTSTNESKPVEVRLIRQLNPKDKRSKPE
jgi:hypothetical protein